MATTTTGKSNSPSNKPKKKGNPGKAIYGLKKDLHRAGISLAMKDHELHWKQDEIDKLKQELEHYKIAYLQEENVLKKAIMDIGRIIDTQDRYTKKQLLEKMDQILSSLDTNVSE